MATLALYTVSDGAQIARCDNPSRALEAALKMVQHYGYTRFEVCVEQTGVTISVGGVPFIATRPFESCRAGPGARRPYAAYEKPIRPRGWQPVGRPPADGWYKASGLISSAELQKVMGPAGKQALVFLDPEDEVLGAVLLDPLVAELFAKKGVKTVALRDVATRLLRKAEVPEGTTCIAAGCKVGETFEVSPEKLVPTGSKPRQADLMLLLRRLP